MPPSLELRFLPLDGTSGERLKLCCTAWHAGGNKALFDLGRRLFKFFSAAALIDFQLQTRQCSGSSVCRLLEEGERMTTVAEIARRSGAIWTKLPSHIFNPVSFDLEVDRSLLNPI